MTKTLMALGAAAVMTAATMAAPSTAEARWRHGWGPGAVIGGLAAGAIIGGALASRPYYYGPGPYYYEPAYGPGPDCYITHRRVWVDGWGWRVRRVQVCD